MNLNDVVLGKEYRDRNLGDVRVVAFHFDDGAAIIAEVWDDAGDDFTLELTEACFLSEKDAEPES